MGRNSGPRPAFVLSAPRTGTGYWIYERVPAAPGPWPAVVFMDGDDQFRFAVEAYRALPAGAGVPPLLIVGVGYGASYTRPGNQRLRDYTPTAVATEPESGGADGFLSFLTDTLWPELARRHPLRDDVRGMAGHSLGSLLALHALFQRRPFFNRILASAPSLFWDDRALLCRADRLQRTGVALPARLFFGVGEDDTPSMTGDLQLLEDQLAARPFPQLEVISRRFPGHDHYNVLPDAFAAGLQALFG
ncbi:MAG: alpha/beta hydrolase-fold protein [Opitutaceae bacterium]